MDATLGLGDVSVWYCLTGDINQLDAVMDVGAALLSHDERARRDRLRFARDRRDFTAAHVLTRTMLAHYGRRAPGEWRFVTSAYGKPSIVPEQAGDPPLSFNLSHTQGLVACAVAYTPLLGVDVESVSHAVSALDIAHQTMTPSERAALRGVTPGERPARFTEIWTLREAYMKAVGSGLGTAPRSFSFALPGTSGIAFHTDAGPPDHWGFVLTAPSADSRLSVASRTEKRLEIRRVLIRPSGGGKSTARALRWSDGLLVVP